VIAACAAIVSVGWTASSARADGPEVGFNAGAAIAIDKFQRSVHGDVGGTFGFSGGYRWDMSDAVALSILGNPQFTFFPTERKCCDDDDEQAIGIFSITGGPKLTFKAGEAAGIYIGAAGGYYRDMMGPLSDDGAGFNAGGGIDFAIAEGTTLGLFGRYDYARMVASDNTDCDRQWGSVGLAFTHVFGVTEAAEAPAMASRVTVHARPSGRSQTRQFDGRLGSRPRCGHPLRVPAQPMPANAA